MLQLYPVYSLWNRRKTLTGSPDPTHMQMVQINLAETLINELNMSQTKSLLLIPIVCLIN